MPTMDMETIFLGQILERYRSANFDCLFGQENIPFDEPTQFDFDFEPKGTINFTFMTGVSIVVLLRCIVRI